MAHFAKLDDDNIVLAVYVVANAALDSNNEEVSGIEFLTNWSGGYNNWKQTSYNGNFRKQYAGVGYTYNPIDDVFIAPQPYPSWTLDNNFDWQPPIQKPVNSKSYWDELTLNWIEIEA